jgi:predicted nucleic acid-binding Zn ribbon protein
MTNEDNRDYCQVCGKEIPPGPDFCSLTCEEKFLEISKTVKEKKRNGMSSPRSMQIMQGILWLLL